MKQKIVILMFISSFLIFFFVCPNELLAMTKYKVKRGDTMWKISLEQQVDFHALLSVNKQIHHPELIYPGQTIFLPDKTIKMRQENKAHVQQKMLSFINNERRKENLKPFVLNSKLNEIAEKKSKDMLIHKYISHNSPTYGNPTNMLESFNIRAKNVYENVGAGPSTAFDMFNTWLHSQVSRNNMLTEEATMVGIGCVEGGIHQYYWTLLIVENE